MLTVGIDTATHIGLALVGGGDDRGKSIKVNQKGFSRLQSLAGEVERTLKIWKPDLAIVEAYAFARNIDSFTTLVECGTVIKKVLFDLKIRWVEVTPTTLKKWTTGSGIASKDQMKMAIEKRWQYSSKNTDIVDAYALAKMGQLGIEQLSAIPGVKILTLGSKGV